MNFAVAAPGLVAVRADLAAWIDLFGAVGDADTLGGVVLDLANAAGAAVDFRARVV